MKRFTISARPLCIMHCALCIVAALCLTSCGMLYTESDEKLSGSEFWDGASESDVEAFTQSMYYSLRKATMQDAAFLLFSGDLRCAPITSNNSLTSSNYKYITHLTENDLGGLRTTYKSDKDYRADGIMRWADFYEVVQQANILINEISRASVSDVVARRARAEAVFMRCLAYFMMVRNFGDVPYYTNAYNSESLPRTDMITVLHNLDTELTQLLADDPTGAVLPMANSGSKKGVRASRGAVLALDMHVNMWLAGFDTHNAATYYKKVTQCGQELVDNNGGAYTLVPIEQMTGTVFKGASDEGVFEIAQNVSYGAGGEVFRKECVFSNKVMFRPFSASQPELYYTYDFMNRVYPPTVSDDRVKYWFDKEAYTSLATTAKEIVKFENVDSYDGTVTSCSGNQVIFRLGGLTLLYAEAVAELGDDDAKALELLNRVRSRANAPTENVSGTALKDAIYWERVRELIGEGQYFYDLARTGRLCNATYCWHPVTRSQFNKGAWTWPISHNALVENTKMQLNTYWE